MRSTDFRSARSLRPIALAGLVCLLTFALGACGGQASVSATTHQEAPASTADAEPDASPDAPAAVSAAAAPAVAAVGKAAPDFELTDTAGRKHKLSDYAADGKLVVLEWFNPDCPIAKAYHVPENQMAAMAADYRAKNVVWLAINSGAEGKQGAGLDRNKRAVEEYGINYPILLDMSGDVGHQYEAKTTPHMYVIDTAGVLRYAGAIDDGTPNAKGDVNYVKQVLEEILADKPVTTSSSKPFGCSVKYGS
jgi:peroxiredoxin